MTQFCIYYNTGPDMISPFLYFVAFLLFSVSVVAQDYRNDMFGTRRASHESRVNKRGDVTQVDERLRPFYHGVASGDPLSDRVIIWTRVTPENGAPSVDVRYIVATDTGLVNVVRSGKTTTSSERDFTVKIDVDGLQPGTVYYYGFTAYDRHSLTGRTHTTQLQGTDHARFAVVSCSNYPAGFFNAYGRIADRNDLDAILHLGDYIYEYDADTASYGGLTGKRLGRSHDPDAELITLTDYRTRYSQYRLDPDLIRAHQQHPMIHIWDDHESANDAYTDGAENHQPSEGEWAARKTTSKRVCYEWLPTRENPENVLYRGFSFGGLVDLLMLDTRLDGRDKQVNNVGEGAPQSSKDSLNDANRKIMSTTQYSWLTDELKQSTSTWRLIGNQVMFTPIDVTPIDTTYLFNAVGPLFAAFIRPQLPLLQAVFESAFYGDVWSNYPAQRKNLISFLQQNTIDNIVIATGDFHCSFAMNVPTMESPTSNSIGVEFMTPSVSAPNFDENLQAVPSLSLIVPALLKTIDTTITGLNPNVRWQNIVDHGYELIDFTPERVQCDWFFVDTILVRSTRERWVKGYATASEQSSLGMAASQAPRKVNQDQPAPKDPPQGPVSVDEQSRQPLTILGYGPNPARDAFSISYVVDEPTNVRIVLVDNRGIEALSTAVAMEHGLHSIVLDLHTLATGRYTVVVHAGTLTVQTGIVVVR